MIRRRPGLTLTLAVVAMLLGAGPGIVRAQSDNFNDGNDAGWSRYSPLGALGFPGVFSFPNGGYRIQTTVPTGSAQNPPRAGSLRQDATYADFYVAVDLVNWKDDTRQAFGLLARIGTPGFIQTSGYAFTYERGSGVTPTSGDTDISRLTDEVPEGLGSSSIHLNPAKDYRLVFTGHDSFGVATLEGRIYELPNTVTPVLTLTVTDPAPYPSGFCGLVIYDNSGGTGVCDATFDNYFATDREPPRFTLVDQGFNSLKLSWTSSAVGYKLQSSPSLSPASWTDDEFIPVDDAMGNFYAVVDTTIGNKFYRLVKP